METPREDELSKRGVIKIRGMPPELLEGQLRKFFGQFGTVTNVIVARSKKTAVSRGFGFLEFEHASVAEIVAKKLPKYMLFGTTMYLENCAGISESERAHIFRLSKRRWTKPNLAKKAEALCSARCKRSKEEWEGVIENRHKKLLEKLGQRGINLKALP